MYKYVVTSLSVVIMIELVMQFNLVQNITIENGACVIIFLHKEICNVI